VDKNHLVHRWQQLAALTSDNRLVHTGVLRGHGFQDAERKRKSGWADLNRRWARRDLPIDSLHKGYTLICKSLAALVGMSCSLSNNRHQQEKPKEGSAK
jgi:hypothetical protein